MSDAGKTLLTYAMLGASLHDAGLGVGHIWTAVDCPAYRTLDGADCTCGVTA